MSFFGSFVCGALILTGIFALCLAVFWLAFGRKKKGEDKAIGLLEFMAHFKATSMIDSMQRRIR